MSHTHGTGCQHDCIGEAIAAKAEVDAAAKARAEAQARRRTTNYWLFGITATLAVATTVAKIYSSVSVPSSSTTPRPSI